jgi:hypothetical protein
MAALQVVSAPLLSGDLFFMVAYSGCAIYR